MYKNFLRKLFLFCLVFIVSIEFREVAALNNNNIVEPQSNSDITDNFTVDSKINDSIITPLEVPIYYKYDYVVTQVVQKTPVETLAGQLPGGKKFGAGGGGWFYLDNNTGPNVTVSFSFNLGPSFSVGVGFGGIVQSGGTYCGAPNGTDYFKLAIRKYVDVTQKAVYGYPTAGGPRVFLYYIYISQVVKEDCVPYKVG